MGSFVLYILEWALCLLIFLAVYKVCFSGSTFHRFNRFYLLGCVVVAALLPLIHVGISNNGDTAVRELRIADTPFVRQLSSTDISHVLYQKFSIAKGDTSIGRKVVATSAQGRQAQMQPSLWAIVLILAYLVYVVLLVFGWTKSFYKMTRFISGKRSHRLGRWIRIVVHDGEFGPFSWLNYIVISSREDGFARKASMLHEISHIKKGHAVDLFVLLVCSILNPVCWLVLKEIKIVHEYEADNEVINRYHIHKRDYQRLLIIRTVGAEAYALASSFNLNIKQRIKMMKKKQSTWWRMSCIILTVPIVGIALTAFAEPREALIEGINREANNIAAAVSENLTTSGVSSSDKTAVSEEAVTEQATTNGDKLKPGENVSGVVYGTNNPLRGANVVEYDANNHMVNAVMTNDKGEFSLRLKNPSNRLKITYVGYKTYEANLNQKHFEIKMETSTSAMDEVAVVGYVPSNATSQKAPIVIPAEGEFIEQMPAYPGGNAAWTRYLSEHLRYPATAQNCGAQAKIQVVFIVDKNGYVRSPKVAQVIVHNPLDGKVMAAAKNGDADAQDKVDAYNDAIESLKEEAVNVMRHSSKWIPGRQNGNAVNCQYSVPVNFSLK